MPLLSNSNLAKNFDKLVESPLKPQSSITETPTRGYKKPLSIMLTPLTDSIQTRVEKFINISPTELIQNNIQNTTEVEIPLITANQNQQISPMRIKTLMNYQDSQNPEQQPDKNPGEFMAAGSTLPDELHSIKEPSVINETVISESIYSSHNLKQLQHGEIFSAQFNSALSLIKISEQYISNLKDVPIHKKRHVNGKLELLQEKLTFFEIENKKWRDLYERESSIHLDSILQTVLHSVNKTIDQTLNSKLESFMENIKANVTQPNQESKASASTQTQSITKNKFTMTNFSKTNKGMNTVPTTHLQDDPHSGISPSLSQTPHPIQVSTSVPMSSVSNNTGKAQFPKPQRSVNNKNNLNALAEKHLASQKSTATVYEVVEEETYESDSSDSNLITAQNLTFTNTKFISTSTNNIDGEKDSGSARVLRPSSPSQKHYTQPPSFYPTRTSKFIIMSIPHDLDSNYLNKRLNEELETDFKINEIKRYSDQHQNFHLIFEVPSELKFDLKHLRGITLHGSQCSIRPFNPARRCSNCHSYKHATLHCKYSKYCGNCASKGHSAHQCNESTPCCINCIEHNKDFGSDYNIYHTILDSRCPTFHFYKRKNFASLYNSSKPNPHRVPSQL